MSHSKDNLIQADFIYHGSNENEHFLDPNRLPGVVSSQLRDAVMESAIKKRVESDLPKLEAIWKAESNKLREKDNKISADKINNLSLEIDRLIRDNTSLRKETKLKLEKLTAEKDKEKSEALQLKEQDNVDKINLIKTKLSEQKETIDKKNYEIREIKNQNQITLLKEKEKMQKEFTDKEEKLRKDLSVLEIENQSLKDFRTRGTKITGIDLEDHCENLMASLINNGLNAKLERDTVAIKGGMLDFILTAHNDAGETIEKIGIEVKNESLDSTYKQKNSKHFTKFENDCNNRGIQCKLMVSTLEQGNELFDNGIYKVPNYKNMYVCRPQHLMPFLGLLIDQAKERFKYKEAIKSARESNFQIEVIQDNMNTFRFNFLNDINDWEKSYDSALKGIETIIQKLNKLKLDLLNGKNSIKFLTEKVEDFTIKKLTSSGKLLQSSLVGNK